MTPESFLFSTLSGDSFVSAIVGTRVYPGRAPQGVKHPYITFQRTDTEVHNTLNYCESGSQETPTYQVDVWAKEEPNGYDQSNEIMRLVVSSLTKAGAVWRGRNDGFISDWDVFRASADFRIYLEV